jgi:L-alanine-DL-glutamate epimerase-like enolase superfamily enzyme
MTITSFRVGVMQPLSAAIIAPRFNVGSINNIGVHLVDDSGVEGFGYAYVFDASSAEAISLLMNGFAETYVGTEVEDLRKTRSTLLVKKVNFLGMRGMARVAAAALDMAAWDLLCRRRDTNLVGLIGKERDAQPAFTAAALWSGISPDELARLAPKVAADFNTPYVKMWLGDEDLGLEKERITAVCEAIGDDGGVIIDAAQAYDWRSAAKLARSVEHLNIVWFEDPVEYEDLDGLRRLGQSTNLPLGTGEHVYGIDHLKQHLDTGALEYLVLDLERIGGVTDFLTAAALCEAYRVQLVNHCFPHTSLQILATSPAGSWCELAPLWDPYFGKLDVSAGEARLNLDVPGLGVEFVAAEA